LSPGVKVLLLGKSGMLSSFLVRHLKESGCDCWDAASTEEALALIERHAFQLILSTRSVRETSRLLARCREPDCNGFFFFPVEDGGWWVPLVRHGENCLGAPAARRSEFVGLLDELLREIGSSAVDELTVSNA